MKPGQYAIERRASALGQAIPKRIEMMRQAITPDGKRPPFTEQLSERDALAWWRAHRFDHLGLQLTANMTQMAVLELDRALSQQIERDQQMEVQIDGAIG